MSGDRTFHIVEAVVDRGDDIGATVRRPWPDAFKEQAVAATLAPGVNVSAIARQMGISPSQLFGWRRLALAKGNVVERNDAASLSSEMPARVVPLVEIVLGAIVVRTPADIGEADLRRLIRAVRSA